MVEKRTLERGMEESKEAVDKQIAKGKNVAGRVVNDLGKTMDDILINLKSFQKDLDSKITEYKETNPSRIDLDLIDSGEVLYIKADLPGVAKEDIDIEIVGKELTISAFFGFGCEDNDNESHKDECNFLIKGRKYGPAKRTINLPTKVKSDNSKAEFKNGVLFLELPKIEIQKLKVDID
ncbi:MAG: Hsp20/alpha crystallin family protein [Methanobrevibacter sp.]|jgi:HSP20 family protein|nr:Hsp20/alpha crystallin family protein [Methanobrevibacter sp.]